MESLILAQDERDVYKRQERGMPNVPTFESLSRMMKPEHLWPQNDAWGQHDLSLIHIYHYQCSSYPKSKM